MLVREFAKVALVVVSLAAPASAADVSGLGWGEFVANETNTGRAATLTGKAEGRSLSMTMTLEDFSASAENTKTDASATFSGNFLVMQPAKLDLTSLHATISGIIVKTAGAAVHLDVAIGPAKTSIDWTDAEVKSERFTKDIDVIVPAGRLPSPFEVAALAIIKKAGKDGTALVTVDQISIEIGQALVGSLVPAAEGPVLDSKKSAPPEAAPTLFASKN